MRRAPPAAPPGPVPVAAPDVAAVPDDLAEDAGNAAEAKPWRSVLGWHVLLALDLASIAYLAIRNLIQGSVLAFRSGSEAAKGIERSLEDATAGGFFLDGAPILVLFGLVPFLWVLGTRRGGWAGARQYLRLRHAGKGLGLGVAGGVGLWIAVLVLSLVYVVAVYGTDPEAYPSAGPVAEALARVLTWPLAFFLAASAAVGEEVFFRGVLRRWAGVWGQAAVFGVLHAGYGTAIQVVLPFLIGVAFGYTVKWTRNLWIVIGAHFTFNFIQLGIRLLTEDLPA